LLLRCVHCCAVFESEQIRDPLGLAAGKLFTPYELFPLCPSCGTARWCPAEDARLEAIRRRVPRRRKLFGGGA
jgi:rubredoxin